MSLRRLCGPTSTAEVFDSGGRPVSAAGTVGCHVYPHYLGLKVDAAGPRRVDGM